MGIDKRALKILFDTYWSPTGWKSAGHPNWAPQTPSEDYEYALRQGVMFPLGHFTHDEALAKLIQIRGRLTPQQVGAAFCQSILDGQVSLRSALGSYAVALHLPAHSFQAMSGDVRCHFCGGYESRDIDYSIFNFERHKWGGVRHTDPAYIAFDLERFEQEAGGLSDHADRQWVDQLNSCITSMSAGSKLADLVRAIKPMVPGNESQRRIVIGLLGYAGILSIPGRADFLTSFVPIHDREETRWYKDDWPYPVRWWRGGHGVNSAAIDFWFQRQGHR